MLYIIVNPSSKSGRGQKKWRRLQEELNRKSIVYEIFYTKKGTGAAPCVKEILESIDHSGHSKKASGSDNNVICVLGGDGTINETVNALYLSTACSGCKDSDVNVTNRILPCLIYFPAGSSNDLARALRLSDSPEDFVLRLKAKKALTTDTGLLQTPGGKKRMFCVSCGIGYDAAVCKEALHSPLKDVLNRMGLGKLTYAGIALKQLLQTPVTSCDLSLADGTRRHFERFLFAAALLHPYEGGGIKMAPHADGNDGRFDLLVVAGLAKWRALYLLPLAFFGLHTRARNVYFFRSEQIRLRTGMPLSVHADGEDCGSLQELTLTCGKNNLKYL